MDNALLSNRRNQVKPRQIAFFFLAFLPVTKIFSLPSVLAKTANEDLWISLLMTFIVELIVLTVILIAVNKTDEDFYTATERIFGKVGAKVLYMLLFVYLIAKLTLPMNRQENYIQHSFYETLPSLFPFFSLFVLSIFLCCKPIRIVGRLADVLWLATVLGIVILFALSISNVDFSALLPVGYNGIINISLGSYKSISWCGDSLYLLFFMGTFKPKKHDNIKIVSGFSVAYISAILFSAFFYGIFTSISSRQTFALTEIAKYSTVINNVGRLDYLGIMLILLSTTASLSLPLYFATDLLKKTFNIKKPWISALITNAIMVAIILAIPQYYSSLERIVLNYLSGFFIFIAVAVPIILCIIILWRNKGEKNTN